MAIQNSLKVPVSSLVKLPAVVISRMTVSASLSKKRWQDAISGWSCCKTASLSMRTFRCTRSTRLPEIAYNERVESAGDNPSALATFPQGGFMDTRLNRPERQQEGPALNTSSSAIPRVAVNEAATRVDDTAGVKIDVRMLNFWYGAKQALYYVSMPIREKQVTALIGPSGCGKSTFLRPLNRMNDLIPRTRTEGEALFDGHNIY